MYLTLLGIVLGWLSLFWSFGYVRLGRKLCAFLNATEALAGGAPLEGAPRTKRSDVINMLEKVGCEFE